MTSITTFTLKKKFKKQSILLVKKYLKIQIKKWHVEKEDSNWYSLK